MDKDMRQRTGSSSPQTEHPITATAVGVFGTKDEGTPRKLTTATQQQLPKIKPLISSMKLISRIAGTH
jgi:hypothetical protein